MKNKVLVVAGADSFIVRGLQMKIQKEEIETSFVGLDIGKISSGEDSVDLIIVYMDDSVLENTDILVYLNNMCLQKDKLLCIIGSKAEYDASLRYIDKDTVWMWFERPLEMDKFLSKLRVFIDSSQVPTAKRNILIVDDDLDYMHMIREWLKDKYRVSMANSGIQAITWLAKNKVDLILLDYEMPVTDGPQVLEMLRSENDTKNIPVMFLTGKSDRGSIMKVLDLKPTGYLLKSISRDELHTKLGDYFSGTGK